MFKKINITFIIFILLAFAGCSNKNVDDKYYVYKGENESWIAQFKVIGAVTFTEKDGRLSAKSNAEHTLTVTYKKNLSELSSIKRLEISYESSAGGGKLIQDFDKPPTEQTYILKSGGSNTAIENSDETVKVTINIDGKEQTLDLKNKQ